MRAAGAGASAEVAERQVASRGIVLHPVRDFQETFCEKVDVEAQMTRLLVDALLLFGQQVHQQGSKPASLQDARNIAIPWTVTATAAAVSEKDDAGRPLGDHQVTGEPGRANFSAFSLIATGIPLRDSLVRCPFE